MPFIIQQPPPIEIIRTESSNRKTDEMNSLKINRELIDQAYIKETFHSLKEAWERKTRLYSSVWKIIEDRNFKRIVEMGPKAVPFIIEELERKPSTLVWALNLITGTTLKTTTRLTITESCKMWVKLYKQGKITF
jgi:predicted patatin/cPLA2 family phospholipase